MPDRRGLLPCVRPGLARNSRPRPGPQAWRQTAGPARTCRPFGQTDRHRPVSAPAPPRQWGFSGSGASPVAGLARSSRPKMPPGNPAWHPAWDDRAASGAPPRNRLRPARPHATARLNGIPPTWPETSAKPSGSRSETMIPWVWKVGKKLWIFLWEEETQAYPVLRHVRPELTCRWVGNKAEDNMNLRTVVMRVRQVWLWVLGSSPRMTKERMGPGMTTEGIRPGLTAGRMCPGPATERMHPGMTTGRACYGRSLPSRQLQFVHAAQIVPNRLHLCA
ncbi:hypothetical protein HPDFL43_00041580 [Hoeflea phototrophica DFL-43]|uniref:Uncharacterized protein n=1 Tax=Hoeflea phototrophica (strain DSM 17068 / NCIMB 14078 / DFL-43) TaxID=411684 RepID=A0A094Z061_HOEPD|nr:hypothetical protein HPDFL43_00041580 [Hoeflea phototrophica DFL-43]